MRDTGGGGSRPAGWTVRSVNERVDEDEAEDDRDKKKERSLGPAKFQHGPHLINASIKSDVSELRIRPASELDKAPVMKVSESVWEGNDYLPEVWDQWIAEPAGQGFLMVGELEGRVVAVQHISFQPGDVAWMEGIRVDSSLRNKGIGGSLLQHALDVARERGCRKARLSTAELNPSSSAVATSQGFVQVMRFSIYTASTIDSSDGRPDAPFVMRRALVSDQDVRDLRKTLGHPENMIVTQWTAYDLPGQVSARDFPTALACFDGHSLVGVAFGRSSKNGRRLALATVLGPRDAVRQLGGGMMVEAKESGYESVQVQLPADPERAAGLIDAGFERNETLVGLVFEASL